MASELAFHHWRLRRGISLGREGDAALEREHLEQLLRLRGPIAGEEARPFVGLERLGGR